MNRKPSTVLSFFSLSKTASDAIERVTQYNIPYYDCNLHCYTHPLYYGDGTVMSAYMNPGDVAFFQNGNLRDIQIQNYTTGSDGVMVITATIPTEFVKEELRI
jgi:hypothetical protein